MAAADAVLLDIDGVLVVSWEPLPGAVAAVAELRRATGAVRFVTNTTSRSRRAITESLRAAGFDLDEDEVLTAAMATVSYLRTHHPGRRCLVLNSGDAEEDLAEVPRAARPEDAEVVVLGGAGDAFDHRALSGALRALQDGAALVAMHRNLFWRTAAGDELDTGAYLLGLERATGTEATVVGKPSCDFFGAALDDAGVGPGDAVMVGDDLISDVLGAQRCGLEGVLVRTGKFRPDQLERAEAEGEGRPDHVVDSIADVSELLARGGR